ncbi:GlxA family transcriptional regulator [Mycobacterium deserti]|uniref:Helix-turn-helix domain-containing protein n=1 Tax=Mycobacterium deserti TaxID=2978347 RepID=A0ABT2MH61_9MYCO|nr:helix-turn-helix domain-containing protein [Mycobacterium deserti]MCT7660301.1 helix-turn-helix domain-containing protein [Mycobacterium deserti]
MHTVAVLALPDVIGFDLCLPVETFGRVQLACGERGYRVVVCGTEPVVSAGPMRIATDHGLDILADADTIVVPGCNTVSAGLGDDVADALKSAFVAGTRIASICTGAFTLAGAGLLDGRRATTHWLAADAFRAAFPAVQLDPDVLYVDEGQVLTSAGASAGMDLCLYMIACDYGSAVAADAARMAVAPLHRSGGQAQFIMRNRAPIKHIAERTSLDDVLAWIEREAHRELTLRDIAECAAMSIRTLNRRFQAETGQTPMQWVTGVRIRHAQQLLETTPYGVERIGMQVGFSSPANFREQFRRLTGVAPQSYRTTFRAREERNKEGAREERNKEGAREERNKEGARLAG